MAGGIAALPFLEGVSGLFGLVAFAPFFAYLYIERKENRSFRRGFASGWAFGVGFFLVLLYWIALLADSEIPVRGITAGGWVLMSAYLALFTGVAAGVIRVAGCAAPLWIVAPAAWGLAEYGRSLGTLGFPWGSAGYLLADHPVLLQSARFGAVHLLSFWVILVNTLVALGAAALWEKRRGAAITYLASAALLVVAAALDGRATILRGPRGSSPAVTLALVQPNILAEEKWTAEYRSKAVDIMSDLSRDAAAEGADLIVWPETAVPSYIRQEFSTFRRIVALAKEIDAAILFGFPDARYVPGEGYVYFNSAMLLARNGEEAGEYRKIHLVPFGETLPLSDRFEWIDKIQLGQADFRPGKETHPIGTPRTESFAPTICFEAIFPSLCRRRIAEGALYLVNLTNDAWFGTTAAPFQHAAMARVRCVELGVYLVRAANTGISLIADPFGRVVKSIPLAEKGYAAAPITPERPDTFYLRHGDWMAALEGLIVLAALLGAFFGRSAHSVGRDAS